ncbi:MAG TPA: sugar ABC transporter permease [Candidatus Limnocylindria bacterium]|nr:sugar ABC transporter permease [Candidatus Limnocylindria bacterium]
MTPALIGIGLFHFLPIIIALRGSLFELNLLVPERETFVGLDNFRAIASDEEFRQSLLNTLVYTVSKLGVQLPLSFGLALFIEARLRGTTLLRSAIFAPTVTAVAIAAVIWGLMYQPHAGLINSVLGAVGIEPQSFLTSKDQALPSIIALGIWQDTGLTVLILLGGLQGIPREFYEAAVLDGASGSQAVRYLTLPLLRRTILFAVVLTTLLAFKVFAEVKIMTEGGPENSTLMTVYYIYKKAFVFLDLGYAFALAVVLMAILVVIALLQGRLLRSRLEY